MAVANPAESLRDEASCSICLDYFTDPVTIDCGHNFCRSCITQSWEGRDTDFPCPQCRALSLQRNLRPNRQLANVTEMVKKLSHTSVRPKEENLCEEHEEKLKLFCEEDQRAICVVCDRSRDHRSHTVIPIKEAVQEYKEKLKMHLKPLRKNLEDLLKFTSTEEKKAEELKSETQIKRQKVESEFEELQQFLNKEKQILLSKLEEEEKKILQRIRENETQLEQQSFALKQLITEIEEKSQQPANELLKDVKDALSRCQKMKFPKPEAVSTDLKMDFQLTYPQQLKKWITKFEVKSHPAGMDWWMEFGRYTVNVTLDPETADSILVLSEDGKSVRWRNTGQIVPDTPQRFDYDPCVLGSEGFTSGRHYWEVEVGGVSYWILGVCKDSVRRKGKIKLSPGEGFWTVGLWYEQRCWALTSPQTQLPLSEFPRAVGILLDYEAGKVSFYDADNKSHLFTFTDSFTGKLRPLFRTISEIPLRIRQVPAWN
ncbi:E3 ubiquitin-protein ligase TRIM39-like isoform X2 [Microcaecilia unicolor]|uniref:E3 ubiquitin-protein ligase TRIM39-like isoform X1 n=1 Tax=Microcaecilia unicolor TaxID=1415580 RepID=A0A6P7XJI6_9AMPH|nr:E3 ubiquitin-protein ligase TRIM39-like isoform X1 [Microcaecilia unicolor]XP_030055653.1 E3 ubiquitin-protein ligase TRIM39-like isoform X2 [Microcaecilia unicolor]